MQRGAGGSQCLRTDDCSVTLINSGAGSAARAGAPPPLPPALRAQGMRPPLLPWLDPRCSSCQAPRKAPGEVSAGGETKGTRPRAAAPLRVVGGTSVPLCVCLRCVGGCGPAAEHCLARCSASSPGPRLCPRSGGASRSFPSLQRARAAWWCSAMHWQHAKQAVYNR